MTGNQRRGEKVCLADETGCQEGKEGESEPTSAPKFPESALSSSVVTAETVIRQKGERSNGAALGDVRTEERWRSDKGKDEGRRMGAERELAPQ